jgi:hypothetical protein
MKLIITIIFAIILLRCRGKTKLPDSELKGNINKITEYFIIIESDSLKNQLWIQYP